MGNDSQLSTEDERAIQAVALQFVQNLRHRQMFGLEALENSMDHICMFFIELSRMFPHSF